VIFKYIYKSCGGSPKAGPKIIPVSHTSSHNECPSELLGKPHGLHFRTPKTRNTNYQIYSQRSVRSTGNSKKRIKENSAANVPKAISDILLAVLR